MLKSLKYKPASSMKEGDRRKNTHVPIRSLDYAVVKAGGNTLVYGCRTESLGQATQIGL